jgi:probable phosphoglycerate mutase
VTETTVVVVRHGRTAAHAENRYIGRTDLALDRQGLCQADELGSWAAGQSFTTLVCSPMSRARATIAPVAALTGLAIHVDERLRELDFGVAEGRTLAELTALDPVAVGAFLADPAANHFPLGEHPKEAADRAMAAVAEAVSADPGGRILVVSHNTLIRLLTCAVLGIPLSEYRRLLPRIDPCAAVTLSFGDGRAPALIAFNVPVAARCDDPPGDGSRATRPELH